jgi:hypothetical protein
MNNDLLKISLNQGKQFNIYQKNISQNINGSSKISKTNKKIKEGFVSAEQEIMLRPPDEGYVSVLQKQNQTNKIISNSNQDDLNELTQLQTKYQDLMQQYTEIQKSTNTSSLESINRTSSDNPYLNKNIKFTDGTICYVTNEGIAKPYQNLDMFKNTSGKNGCPTITELINLDIPWSASYITGSVIPTNPSLIVGKYMVEGEACGSEGKNVYASKLVNNPSNTYIGCYNNNSSNNDQDNSMNATMLGYTSLDKCQDYAINNSYQYFGMQDYQTDGISQCVVSNDIDKIQMYGDGSKQTTLIALWASNTYGNQGAYASLTSEGILNVYSSSGDILFSTPNGPSDCKNYYSVTNNSDSYGNDITSVTNTTLDNCQLLCNNNDNCAGIVFGKSGSYANTCWIKNVMTSPTPNNDLDSYTKNPSLQNKQNCKFFLILQDDGNMCIYRGQDPSNNTGVVWASATNGSQNSINNDWKSTNGKSGANYIMSGTTLASGEWIGSTDGSLQLYMQTDGNLVLYTSNTKSGCITDANGNTYGGSLVNAVYKLNSVGNSSTLGKIGYIDSDSNLREYPDSLLGFSNDYQIYQDYDISGDSLYLIKALDESGCQTICNNDEKCVAYTYNSKNMYNCSVKSKNTLTSGVKQSSPGSVLGIRKPKVLNTSGCSSEIVDIDTIHYDSYIKGDPMSSDTQCNASIVSQEDRIKMDNISSQLFILGQDIASKMETLYDKDNNIYKKLNTNAQQFKKDIEKYKQINMEIQSNNNIEGMQNMNSSKNINDINGMLSDTDLIVLQENYSYILWSILAVGILTITLSTIKK